MGIDAFRYDGRRALVIGAATGMGAATAKLVAELGAEVTALDVAEISYPVKQALTVDLADRASIDAALEQIEGDFQAVFCCAGVADGTPNIMTINFISQRYLLERLLERGALPRGAAVAMISSVAGLGWQQDVPRLTEFLDQSSWEDAAAWIAGHDGTDSYVFSKQAMNTYVARQALALLKRGIRINAIEPGPTDTPLARANADIWLAFAQDYRDAAGVSHLSPEQVADTLVYLCSDAASGISGISMLVDQGHISSTTVGTIAPPQLG